MNTIEELNAAVRVHKRKHALNATEQAVLDVLARYSCKEIGRSFLAKSTIAEIVGKSRRTIIRVCNRLEQLGIIRQYERKRQTGDRRQTSNLIVILPAEETLVTPACHTEETPPRNLNNNYINNTYGLAPQSFYAKFRELIASTLGDTDKRLIYRLYGVYKAHSTPLMRLNAFDKESVEAIGWHALKAAIMTSKRKTIRNLVGYYSGTIDRMYDRLYFTSLL